MNARRHLLRLAAGLASVGIPALAHAVQRASLADPLRVVADDALVDSGLAPALHRAFVRDTGVAVLLAPAPAAAALQALERGERDTAITNAPDAETALERQGLAHDRRLLAVTDFVLVGPAAHAKRLGGGRDLARALSHIAEAGIAFVSRADGSGTHLAEQAAWRAAQMAPAGAWYESAAGGASALTRARERNACTLVERGVWTVHGARGFGVLAEGDPRFAVDVHVLRSFRAEHPAAKLFVAWLAGPKGRAVAAAHRGYRPPRG